PVGLVGLTYGMANLGREAFTAAGQLQQTQAALSGMYADGRQAEDMMKRLRKEFGDSHLELTAFADSAQALAYVGVEGDRAVNIMRTLETALTTVGGTTDDNDSVNRALL